MKFLVEIRVFESIVGDLVPKVQMDIGKVFERVVKSGKSESSGILMDGRGAYFVVNINGPEEMFELFGVETYDTCSVVMHPVAPMEVLAKVFEKNMKK